VGIAAALLFALEVTFVAVVPTGRSGFLSPSSPRRYIATPHEAISISPLIGCCTLLLKSNRTKIKMTELGCFFGLQVPPDSGACLTTIRSLLLQFTSRNLAGSHDTLFFNVMTLILK
jgi:hypothetical protein